MIGQDSKRVLSVRFYAGLVCALLMSACTFHNPAPIVDHSEGAPGPSQNPAGTYRVRPGDTLFGIAFSYGLDQRQLASWNNIVEPFTIYPEQLLRLTAPSAADAGSGDVKIYKATAPQSTTTRTYTTRDVPPTASVNTQKPVPPAVTANTPKPVPPAVTANNTAKTGASSPVTPAATQTNPQPAATTVKPPVATNKSVPPASKPVAKPAPKPATPAAANKSTTVLADPTSWMWPTSGRVLRGFVAGDPARNGVDIAGKEGQAIQATAAGTVVYSGNGLIGYGELIIIKHSDNMLSAYAHNKVRLANEGQQVAAGEKIAEMGRNDRNEQILHFEIRVRGKPVNPLTYLPKK